MLLARLVMNYRALGVLGLLLGVAAGKHPGQLLSRAHGALRERQGRAPMNAVVETVLGAAAAFYWAERDKNPKVKTYYDALVFASTNVSVGHCDILAVTPLGKSIGSLLMTYGPALAARAFDAPTESAEATALNDGLAQIAGKLEAILAELRAQRPEGAQARRHG